MSSVTSSEDHQSHSLYKKAPSIHRRNNSGELDVFEAANYFSLASNMTIHEHQHQPVSSHKPNKENFTTKSYKEHVNDHAGRSKGGRMSLDVVGRSSKIKVTELKSLHKVHDEADDDHQVVKMMMKNNKPKQPSSPGGRLASFLTSLFNHSTSKKKKSFKQDDQIQMKSRMRRSSISHVDSRSLYLSASATGFRTPPPVNKTYFDDSKSLQDHKRVTPPSKSLVGLLDQRPKISNGLFSLSGHDKSLRNSTNGFGEKDKVYGHEKIEFEFKKFDNNVTKLELHKVENNIDTVKHIEFKKQIKDDDEEEEDGGDESDTSSDLFELPNYDLGEFPSELPVYETTNVEKIKSSAKPDSN